MSISKIDEENRRRQLKPSFQSYSRGKAVYHSKFDNKSMRELPRCPDRLPPYFDRRLRSLAERWASSDLRPKLTKRVLVHWDRLIDNWIRDSSLPLYVRKRGAGLSRGCPLQHTTGRTLVPTDNSPAHWSFMSAYKGLRPSLDEVRDEIQADHIPIAMALIARTEKPKAKFRCCRSSLGNPNVLGWKICHKSPVKLQVRGNLTKIPIEIIHRHFRDFLAPSNMFLIPKALSGLGELTHFTDVLKQYA